MNKLHEALHKARLLLSKVKLTKEPLSDDSTIQYDGDKVEVGAAVYAIDAVGDQSVLPDGSYKTKAGVAFVIKDGVVESVDDSGAKKEDASKDEPVVQTQSKETPIIVTQADKSASGTTETPAAEPADIANTAFTLEAIGALIDKKLLPVWDVINAMQSTVAGYPAMWSKETTETQKVLSTVIDSVVALGKMPDGKQIEEEVGGFKKVPKEIKDSRAYKVMQALHTIRTEKK